MYQNEKIKSDKPIIIIDCHAVGHACKHTYGVLSYDNRPTGVIYGFLLQILMLYKSLETNEFIFAWDSGRSLRKLKIYSGYKVSDLEYTEEEQEEHRLTIQQFAVLRQKVLPSLGFKNVFIQSGYEADDIIASIVLKNSGNFIVASEDKDLYQLLDHCNMWKLKGKKIYTKQDLQKEWEVTPEQWAKQKEYSGCKGDKVPNISGVADKTAIRFINGLLQGKKLQNILETIPEFLERNRKLTKLPFKGVNTFELTFDTKFKITDFIRVFEQYGFNSFLKGNRLKEWKEFCRG